MSNIVNEAQATYTTAPPRPPVESPLRQLVRGRMLELYEGLWTIIVMEAQSSGLSIKEARLSRFEDPEENTWKLVIEVSVSVGVAEAMAYWDKIGRAVDSWQQALSPAMRDRLLSGWAFAVDWSEDAPNDI